jgi:diguanylate cyclase (GGDEF)-like protein
MKVLITDDDITTRLTLRGLLSQHDCEIVEAASGLEALNVIQSENPPNLIFMDWNMPDLSGVEVTSLLRETLSENQPYVIIVSSYNADQQILDALSYGADDYITKPVDGNFLNAKFAVAKRIIDTQEKLKQTNKVLQKLAYYDELTGVLNRRAGDASFMVEVERCVRGDQNLSVAMVDIDYFKKVNDTYGHQVGDTVLKAFANVLRKTIRPYDIVCRYGGEEFMLIAEVNSEKEAQQLFERVRSAVNALEIKAGQLHIKITASFGVYVVTPTTQLSLHDMVKHADQALYQAKAEGRNRVIVKSKLEADNESLQEAH